jgi:hypothetical protein
MKDMMFRGTALLLSLAFAGAPVATNFCAASCEAVHLASAAGSNEHDAHHHHHSSTALGSVSQTPQPCGHDHQPIVGVEATHDVASVRALAPSVAVMPTLPVIQAVWTLVHGIYNSSSPPGTSLRGFASPLRV